MPKIASNRRKDSDNGTRGGLFYVIDDRNSKTKVASIRYPSAEEHRGCSYMPIGQGIAAVLYVVIDVLCIRTCPREPTILAAMGRFDRVDAFPRHDGVSLLSAGLSTSKPSSIMETTVTDAFASTDVQATLNDITAELYETQSTVGCISRLTEQLQTEADNAKSASQDAAKALGKYRKLVGKHIEPAYRLQQPLGSREPSSAERIELSHHRSRGVGVPVQASRSRVEDGLQKARNVRDLLSTRTKESEEETIEKCSEILTACASDLRTAQEELAVLSDCANENAQASNDREVASSGQSKGLSADDVEMAPDH